MSWLEHCSIDVVVGDVLDLDADVLVLATKDGPRPYGRLTRSLVGQCGDGHLRALAAEREHRRVACQPSSPPARRKQSRSNVRSLD